jgi:hypothetical protein
MLPIRRDHLKRTLGKIWCERPAQTANRLQRIKRPCPELVAPNKSRLSGLRSCLPRGCTARLLSLPLRWRTIALVQNCRSSNEKTAGFSYWTWLPRSADGSLRNIFPPSTAPAPLKLQWNRLLRMGSRSLYRQNRLCQDQSIEPDPLHPRFKYQRTS